MTAYIADHLKKVDIFEKREAEMRHALKHAYSEERLFRIAEKIRVAKLAVFKAIWAKGNEKPPSLYHPDEEAQEWQSLSASEIINRYRK